MQKEFKKRKIERRNEIITRKTSKIRGVSLYSSIEFHHIRYLKFESLTDVDWSCPKLIDVFESDGLVDNAVKSVVSRAVFSRSSSCNNWWCCNSSCFLRKLLITSNSSRSSATITSKTSFVHSDHVLNLQTNRFSVVECSSFSSATWSKINPSTRNSSKHLDTSLSPW